MKNTLMTFKSTYLSTLGLSGEKLGKSKLPYDEQELKEILETAILDSQQVKLNHNK